MKFRYSQLRSSIGPPTAFTITLFAAAVSQLGAQTVRSWNGASSGAWLTGTNWSPSGTFAGGAPLANPSGEGANTDIMSVIAANTATNIGINMNTLTAGAGGVGLILGGIDFNKTDTAALQIGNNSTTVNGILQINGATINSVANTLVRVAGSADLTIADVDTGSGTQTMGLSLGIANGIFEVGTSRSLTISSIISQAAAGYGFTKTGAGTLNLTRANTYTGAVAHNGGIINISNGSALGSGTFTFGGYNKLILNVADGASMTVANNIILPSTGSGGETELIRVGDATPTAGTTARLTGIISGGAIGQTYTLVDSDATSNHNNTLTLENASNTFSGTVELYRGTLGFTSDGALGNVNNTLKVNLANNNGGLRFDANNITLAATRTINLVGSEVINTQANNGTIAGILSGTGGLRKNGSGTLTIAGANGLGMLTGVNVNEGKLVIAANTLTPTLVVTTATGTTLETTGTLKLNARTTTGSYDAVSGSGTLNLRSASSSALNPDISFNDNSVDESTANYGTAINVPVDLGSSQRFVWGKSNHNSVAQYLSSSGPEANFKGSISGSGGLTFVAQHRFDGSNPMEVSFVLSGANTFTGMVEIQRGSVYLNNANALNQSNILNFTPSSGNNANLFLYGKNASVSNLQSSGAGTSRIGNGNVANPTGSGGTLAATLTVTQTADTTYGGAILNGFAEYDSGSTAAGTLSLIKAGASKLTLTGTNTYTGATSVNAGTLAINGNQSAATGAVTVASGATLGGSGTVGGATTIQTGGHLAVGNSPGTQTFNSTLAFQSGSIFDWEINAATSDTGTSNQGTYDKVIANGAVSGTSIFTIVLGTNAFTDAFWDTSKAWSNIFTGTGTYNLANIFTTFGGSGVASNGLVTGQGQFAFSGNTLNWSAVPEPTSALAGLLITAGLLRRRRVA